MKNKYKIIIAIGILSIAGLISSVVAQKKSAIGVRIMANREHLPARRWYENQNFLKKGNPAPILVDGYDGIKDGNTVYVNAMNILHPDIFGPFYCEKNGLISEPGNDGKCEDEANKNPNFFTNIYVISYTEDAANQTIFNQVISNWKFNSNINLHTHCAGCNGGQAEVDAARAEIRRDTRRLADMAYMHWVFEKFYNAYGYYPKLDSGTYIQNETLSRWPSWQETLGAELGITLQVDPINSFGVCAGNNQGCYCLDHDPETCWNEKTRLFNGARSFKTNLPAGAGLPAGAKVYYYKSYGNGASYEFNASGWESPYIGGDYVGTMQAGHTAGNTKPYVYPVEAVNIAPDEEKIIQLYAYDNDKFTGKIIWQTPLFTGATEGADNSCESIVEGEQCCFKLENDTNGKPIPPITILDNTGKPDEYTGGKFRSYRNLKIKANETDGVCQGKIILRVSDDGIQSAEDSSLGSDTLVIDVRVRNIAPYISGVSKLKGIVGVDFGEAQVLGQDSPGDVLTYEWRSEFPPPGLAMSDTGAITGTPEKEGNFNVWFKAKDQSDASAEFYATINILNKPPNITSANTSEVVLEKPWSFTVAANDNALYNEIDGESHPQLPISICLMESPAWLKFENGNNPQLTNFVINSGFEDGLAGYSVVQGNGNCVDLTLDNANKYIGNHSAKVEILNTILGCTPDASPGYDNYNHVYGIYNTVNAGFPLGGKQITGSVSVKAPIGKNVSLLLYGYLTKSDGNWADDCCAYNSITGNGNWQKIIVPWVVPERAGSVVHFRLSYEQEGVIGDTIYWDNLQLREGGICADEIQSNNMINNPGFEWGVSEFGEMVGECLDLTQDNFQKYDGSYSAKVKILDTLENCAPWALDAWPGSHNYNHVYGINRNVDLREDLGGKKVVGSAWVKAPAGRSVTLLMNAPDLSWEYDSYKYQTIIGNGNWQEIYVPWDVPERSDASILALRLSYEQQGISGDEIHWDALQLGATERMIVKLMGTPDKSVGAAAGIYDFIIKATDAEGAAREQTFFLKTINHPPVFTAFPKFTTKGAEQSFEFQIGVVDDDGHNLNYEISGAEGILQIDPSTGYIRTVENKLSNIGLYLVKVTATDGYDKIENNFRLQVLGCLDNDGDGYGIPPYSGLIYCARAEIDCDDRPAGADGLRGTLDDGNRINPGQPDNCAQYDGVDNNCNGQIDEHALVNDVLTNVDFEQVEQTAMGEKPVGWNMDQRLHSSVGISRNEARSGSQSVLIHQDPNQEWVGKCSQALCESPYYSRIPDPTGEPGVKACEWLSATRQCLIHGVDMFHPNDADPVYNEGDQINWENSNNTTYASLIYNLSLFPFKVGSIYIVKYYYKGDFHYEKALNTRLAYSLDWGSLCWNIQDIWWDSCDSGWKGICVDDPSACCYLANTPAHQTACYPVIQLPGITDGRYNDWTLYSSSFEYNEAMTKVKDEHGNLRHEFGISVGYNATGPEGNNVYIDDFQLLKCENQ